jgi:hypothetical protein
MGFRPAGVDPNPGSLLINCDSNSDLLVSVPKRQRMAESGISSLRVQGVSGGAGLRLRHAHHRVSGRLEIWIEADALA